MSTFLVSGGAGFIGSNIVEALLGEGHRVRVLDDFSTGRRSNLERTTEWGRGETQFELLEGDLRDVATCGRATGGVDYVLHLAAVGSVQRSVEDPLATNEVNVTGTLNLLEGARRAGVKRFVFASSSSLYGESETLPKVESMAPDPISPYGLQKLAGETYCLLYNRLFGLPTVALRYFNVFGPRQNPASEYAAVIPKFIEAAREGRRATVYGDGEQTRDFTFVSNVIEANKRACAAPLEACGRAYNIACGERISLNELLRLIGELVGRQVEAGYEDPRPGDIQHSLAGIEAARQQLDYRPGIGFREGLRRTYEAFSVAAKARVRRARAASPKPGKTSARPFHVVLLAGGSGTRFWPLSRARRPKQLLSLVGPRPLLVETWRRSKKLAPADRIWVVTPAVLAEQVRRMLPELKRNRLIVEPSPRDTGPAVALACAAVSRVAPEAVVGVFPTDHVIGDTPAFVRTVRTAAQAAAEGALVCLGVQPDRPATGFGYLCCATRPGPGTVTRVRRFVEKPDLARARRFLRSGRYMWNAGMFVWGVDRFLDEARRTAPGIVRAVQGHLEGKARSWDKAQRLSVDYAVMEKARGVSLVPLDAGWDDVGSWDAASRLRGVGQGGKSGQLLLDSPGSVVFGDGRLVAVVGVPGVAVVDTPDALLIVDRERSEGVKDVVAQLRRRGRGDLL